MVEMAQMELLNLQGKKNTMIIELALIANGNFFFKYDGENLKVHMTATVSESGENYNTDPNYAYLVEHGDVIHGELIQKLTQSL
jgi:hypothetical protein